MSGSGSIYPKRGGTRDGMPEHSPYADTGCEFAARCQDCTLPACRYDLPPGQARMIGQVQRLLALHLPLPLTGASVNEAMLAQAQAALGVSRRTVYRLRALAAAVYEG